MNFSPSAEPVAWGGAITALATAAIPVLRAFGVDVSEAQSDAMMGLLAALIAVGALLVRGQVTPTTEAQEKVDEAWLANPATDPKPTV